MCHPEGDMFELEEVNTQISHNAILVFDEIGACLPFVAAVCSNRGLIYNKLKTLFNNVRIVFVGTGSELLGKDSQLASDKTSYHLYELKSVSKEWAEKYTMKNGIMDSPSHPVWELFRTNLCRFYVRAFARLVDCYKESCMFSTQTRNRMIPQLCVKASYLYSLENGLKNLDKVLLANICLETMRVHKYLILM